MTILVEIKAQFVRSLPSEGIYRVQVDIIDVVNIDFDVLVFSTAHSTFSHVATAYDLETYPVGYAAAHTANLPFFRGRGTQVSYTSIRDATGFESISRARMKILAVSWASITEAFSGTEIASINSTITL